MAIPKKADLSKEADRLQIGNILAKKQKEILAWYAKLKNSYGLSKHTVDDIDDDEEGKWLLQHVAALFRSEKDSAEAEMRIEHSLPWGEAENSKLISNLLILRKAIKMALKQEADPSILACAGENLDDAFDMLIERATSRSEQANRDKLRQLHISFLEMATRGIFQADADEICTYVNPALLKIFKLQKKEDLVGKLFLPLEFWQKPKERASFIKHLKEHGFIENKQLLLKSSEGETIYTEISAMLPGSDMGGQHCYVHGSIQDITNLKKMERQAIKRNAQLLAANQQFRKANEKIRQLAGELEKKVEERTKELKESENFFKSVLDSIRDGIVLINKEYEISYLNKAPEYALGKPRELMLGKKCYEEFRHKGEVCEFCPVSRTLQTGLPDYSSHGMPKGDDKESFVEVFTFPYKNTEGKVESVIQYVRDVTKKKTLEHQLVQSEKLAMAGALAAGIAHEVNNPLASISSLVQFLLDEEKRPETREALETIIQQVNRISRTLQDFVNYSKPRPSSLLSANLNTIIKQTLRLVSFSDSFKGIELITSFDETLPSITINPDQMQQVLLDMFLNAAHAMPNGGHLWVTTHKESPPGEKEQLAIEIKDDGAGIAQDHLHKIFDPFFSTKPSGKGIGLGLSVCREIIKAHQGKISVESELDHGSCFKIWLPLNN